MDKLAIVGGWESGIPGSIEAMCECGDHVWLSPDSQLLVDQVGLENVEILCIDCFREEIEFEGIENLNIFGPGTVM
jgi:hypothetical protein